MSQRESLEQVEQQTGRRPPELMTPERPAALEYLWEWFLDLSSGRPGGGFAPSPITWEGMEAWARLAGITLSDWERRALKRLDAVFLGSIVPKSTPGRGQQGGGVLNGGGRAYPRRRL